MKNYRFIMGLVIIAIFLLNIGYVYQSFALNSNSNNNSHSKNNNSTPQSSGTPQVTIDSSGNLHVNTQTNPNYAVGSQQKNPNQNNYPSAQTASLASLNTVNITNSQGNTYNGSWYNKDWNYRENITILASEFSANETNFPLLLNFYDKNLKLALSNGYDILFTDSANNKLPYERILFNRDFNTTYTHLIVWVKGTFSNISNTNIMMYFGNNFSPDQQNPSGVWSNGYEAVYHLNSISNGVIIDSTGKHNGIAYTGSILMSSSNVVPGVIGNGILFGGTDKIILNNINSNLWTGLTIEAWVYRPTTQNTGPIVSNQNSTTTFWGLSASNKKLVGTIYTDGSGGTSTSEQSSNLNSGTWNSLGFSWNSTSQSVAFYVNNSNIGTVSNLGSTILDSTQNATMGNLASSSSNGFQGIIDEVRISSVPRSQAWLSDSRKNELNPELFYSLSSNLEKIQLDGNWSFNQLNYRQNITISHNLISETLYNYVYPFIIYDSYLKNNTQVNGNDIAFSDANGTRLEQQIESFSKNYNSTDAKLVIWVKIPIISNTNDTKIYMYYGGSKVLTNYASYYHTWSNYTAVWHLSEQTISGGTVPFVHLDSTGNGFAGNQSGNIGFPGLIGYGQNFNGSNEITFPTASLGSSSKIVISGWFKLNQDFNSTNPTSQVILSEYKDSTNNFYLALAGKDYQNPSVPKGTLVLKTPQSNNYIYTWSDNNIWNSNTWYQFVIMYNKTEPSINKIYVNGIDNTNTTYTCISSCSGTVSYNNYWSIGGGNISTYDLTSGHGYLNGSLDEFRVYNYTPTANELYYTYLTENNSPSLYSISDQRYYDFSPPVIQSYNVTDPGTGDATFWAYITDKSSIAKVFIEINNTVYQLTNNNTVYMYTYQYSPNITYGYTYSFRILNATDSLGYTAYGNLTYQNYTFVKDTLKPSVTSVSYNPYLGNSGTFSAIVTDSWPGIDKVELYVQCSNGTDVNNILMQYNGTYFVNDSIYFYGSQQISYYILAYDIAGNFFNATGFSSQTKNRIPSVSNVLLHSNTGQFYSNETIYVTYNYIDAENDPNQSMILWYKNKNLLTSYTNNTGLPTTAFTHGDNISVSVIAYDGYGTGNTANSSLITIKDTPPVLTSATFQSTNVDSSTNLVIVPVYSDFDKQDSLSLIIRWYRNGSLIPTLNNSLTVSNAFTNKTDYWYFTIKVFDGINYSNQITSNPIYINDTPPIAYNLGFNSTKTLSNESVMITYNYSDYDNDSQSFTNAPIVYWYYYNSSLGIYVYYPYGANQTILPPGGHRIDNTTYYYILRVFDGTDYSANYTSPTAIIGVYADYAAPEISNLYFVNSTNQICNNSCTALSSITIKYTYKDYLNSTYYVNTTELGTIYQWYKNVSGVWVLQSQYNTATLPVGAFSHEEEWLVNVTPSDGTLQGYSQNLTIFIVNIPPVITFASVVVLYSNGTYANITTITTNYNLYANWKVFDGDNDTITEVNITWYDGNTEILANSSYLPSSYTAKNEIWTMSIVVFDGYNWSLFYNYTFSIINSPPVISSLTIVGGENVTRAIYLNYNFYDADGDVNSSIIMWYRIRNGVTTQFLNNTFILNTNNNYFQAGDIIYAIVISNDGTVNGNILTSISITIGDSVPKINWVYIYHDNNLNATFYANDTLEGNYSAFDADGNNGNYGLSSIEFRWYRNGALITTSASVPSAYLQKGYVWILSVRAIDGKGVAGEWVNSSEIEIINAPPQITFNDWSPNNPDMYNLANSTLDFNYNVSDADNKPGSPIIDNLQVTILWYVNSNQISSNDNQSTLSPLYLAKGDNVTVFISVYDGYTFGTNITKQLVILDSPPVITQLSINNGQPLYTNDSLTFSLSYKDYDPGDSINTSLTQIFWYKNGILQPLLNDSMTVSSSYTLKGQTWSFMIRISDGTNYSNWVSSVQYGSFIILNSIPTIIFLAINTPNQAFYTNITLDLNYTEFDWDGDPYLVNITWYKNGNLDSQFNNFTKIDSIYTMKGETWYAIIQVYDGQAYSIYYITPTIIIQDAPPLVTNVGFIFINNSISSLNTRYFYLSDENMTFTYHFSDIDNDPNMTTILWYKDGKLAPLFTNKTTIPFSDLTNGSIWYVELVPNDGQINGTIYISPDIYIYGAPYVNNTFYQIPPKSDQDPEGIYQIIVNTNTTFEPVTQVTVSLDPNLQNDTSVKSLIDSLQSTTYNLASTNESTWLLLDLNLFANNPSSFSNYIGKTITLRITMYTQVTDPHTGITFIISRIYYLTIRFEDLSPPVVHNVNVTFNNPNNPSEIIFTADITDYGSGIQNVTIYYYFESVSSFNSSNTGILFKLMSTSSEPPGGTTILLHSIGGTQYQAIVPFHGNSSIVILYYVTVFDKNGNFNTDAYPKGHTSPNPFSFIYKAPGLSIINVAFIIFIILIFASSVTYVGIKKFRKTEIVGLDVDKVMDEATKIKDYEVQTFLNSHTLGIVVSIFHQVHGPLPIFALPTILTDNLEKLIDLSDRSFSAVRFVENFTDEMQIIFDYSISSATRVSSLSYGFSLERPDARGGAENITLNILLHKPYDAIITKFIPQLDPLVHEIHIILDKDEENKDLIEKKVDYMRNLVSKIILAYQKIYPEGVEAEEDFIDTK